MAAISDASPLILFAWIRRHELLQRIFTEVLVPQAVWDEIMVDSATRPGAQEVAQANWVHLLPLDRSIPDDLLHGSLDPGETEVIALALEHRRPDLVLILDDDPARTEADSRGLTVTGTAGVVLLAKNRGLVDMVTPVLEDLRNAGLYLSPSVAEIIVRSANE